MNVLFSFFLIELALFFTAAVMGGIALRTHYERSPGLVSLLYPFSLLFLSGVLEGLRVLSVSLGLDSKAFAEVAAVFRILNGLGWFLMCHAHLKLHGVLGWRARLTAPVVVLTVGCALLYAFTAVVDGARGGSGGPGSGGKIALALGLSVMSVTALYAALTAILVLRKGIRLWPSSRAGVRMAVFAIIVYPASLMAERFGFIYPFLNPSRTVFEQLYPVFMVAFSSLALPALIARAKGQLAEPGDARASESLTDREREVVLLLRDGKSLKEIAIDLSVSVATVKSHSNNAYRKLGVSGRKELLLISLRR
jgi:DNA-binding CsgD family transcriptional regulator